MPDIDLTHSSQIEVLISREKSVREMSLREMSQGAPWVVSRQTAGSTAIGGVLC